MRKIIKNSNTRQTNTFRLHYFPNIPMRGNAPAARASVSAPPDDAPPTQPRGAHEDAPRPPEAVSDNDLDPQHPAARSQVDAMVKQAYAEGFSQGERDAHALGEQRLAPLVATLEDLTAELTAVRQKLHTQIEKEVVALALHIGRKVIGQELRANRSAVTAIVREALQQVEDSEKITIRMNPVDIQHLQSASIDIGGAGIHGDSIQFQEDPRIEAGGCLVQTEYGEIDARIEAQLRVIEEAFRVEQMRGVDDE